jgi:hypothetical protein
MCVALKLDVLHALSQLTRCRLRSRHGSFFKDEADVDRGGYKYRFEVIVAENSSRLWRELSEQWRALKELQDLSVPVVGHGLGMRREESTEGHCATVEAY